MECFTALMCLIMPATKFRHQAHENETMLVINLSISGEYHAFPLLPA